MGIFYGLVVFFVFIFLNVDMECRFWVGNRFFGGVVMLVLGYGEGRVLFVEFLYG